MERKYYEAYDDRYNQIHRLGLQWFDNNPSDIVLDTIIKYTIGKNESILEIGCGEGRDAFALLQYGYNLTATDISASAIAYCRNRNYEYASRFQILDCINGKQNECYAFIYAVAVIHMLVEDSDRAAFYRFIYDHLSDRGIGLICSMGDGTMERMTDIQNAFELRSRIHKKSGLEVRVANTSCRMVTFDTFRREIECASLSVVEEGVTSVLPDFPCMMYAVVKRI